MSVTTVLGSVLADRYRLERQIGAGGMATVFLARDLKHDRPVALKVMRQDLTVVLGGDRFLSEIRLTANLQHPNLLPLFDSGEAGGLLYYVMPFVDGESLRDRLKREKQLPIDDAVHIATAVASALEHAHSRGVIHRDLKPENILIQSGEPVVADFGIALAVSHAGGERVTQTGISLGTPQYMAPEQATGDRAIDGRADIYALGAVLYEMLTGEPPHTGSSVQAIIARVIADRPDRVGLLRPSVPEHIEGAVDRALEKLPADRWATAREFADALAGKSTVRAPTGAAAYTSSRAVQQALRRRNRWTALGALALTGIAAWGWGLALRTQPAPAIAFTLTTPPEGEVTTAATLPLALSPDGTLLTYVGRAPGNKTRLYLRRLDELTARPLAGTDGSRAPVFSPDGQWISFGSGQTIYRVAVGGGPPVEMGIIRGIGQPSWSSSGKFLVAIFQGRLPRGIGVLSERGDSVIPITRPDTASGEQSHRWPVALDDGDTFLYTSGRGGGRKTLRIGVGSLRTGAWKTLDVVGVKGIGLIEDHLIYLTEDGSILAVEFDARSWRVTGAPFPLVSGVQVNANGAAGVVLSSSGTLAYTSGNSDGRVVLLNRRGDRRVLLPELKRYGTPRLSPDGRRIALQIGRSDGVGDIWMYDLRTSTLSRLTSDSGAAYQEWSSTGKHLVFSAGTAAGAKLFMQPADGSGPSVPITSKWHYFTVHPNGRTLLFTVFPDSGEGRLWYRELADTNARPMPGSNGEWGYRFSPDGKWLAYLSYESGADQVYVRPFPGPGPRVQVSTTIGYEPVWSRDGTILYFRDGRNFVAAEIRTQPVLEVGARATLFEDRFLSWWDVSTYDVTADGSFVLIEPEDATRKIHIIANWREQVRQRLRQR